jgi:hypothetical protein
LNANEKLNYSIIYSKIGFPSIYSNLFAIGNVSAVTVASYASVNFFSAIRETIYVSSCFGKNGMLGDD